MDWDNFSFEEMLFQMMDQTKFLFYPEQWNQTFMDFSKNDLFALIYVYRKKTVTMSEIAMYLNLPLNTITGIISRLEKKQLLERKRDELDKRIVTVTMSNTGTIWIEKELKNMFRIANLLVSDLDKEEIGLLLQVAAKLSKIIQSDSFSSDSDNHKQNKVRKITIE